jgi:hypothetical protein
LTLFKPSLNFRFGLKIGSASYKGARPESQLKEIRLRSLGSRFSVQRFSQFSYAVHLIFITLNLTTVNPEPVIASLFS